MDSDSEDFLKHCNAKVRRIAIEVDAILSATGCGSYYKTIYIGYQLGEEMVAALYPHQSSVEVAVALPEIIEHPLVEDASHLTWRTLPVAINLTSLSQVNEVSVLLHEAVARVRRGDHGVRRENDFFARRRGQNPRRI